MFPVSKQSIMDESEYEDAEELKLEIVNNENGKSYIHTYNIPYRPPFINEKRLICYSIMNNEQCIYGTKCTYAHSLAEQHIDFEKNFLYQIILDQNLMKFCPQTLPDNPVANTTLDNPKIGEIYKQLLTITYFCENSKNNRCTGGYNCKHGVHDITLKICRNDLLTGNCLNRLIDIPINPDVLKKITDVELMDQYQGCINGHHLSLRRLLPYYKYIHQKENASKNRYQSVRYIDISQIDKLFKNNSATSSTMLSHTNRFSSSEESTDEEINEWFQKDKTNEDNTNTE